MYNLSTSLKENINTIKTSFLDDDTLIIREFQIQNSPNGKFSIIFINGMVDIKEINNSIIMPIMYISEDINGKDLNYIKIKSSHLVKLNSFKT